MPKHDLTKESDASLIARFAAGRDQCAFAEIVRRHGPMVTATAQRILRNEHDAEDAFQATFLALATAASKLLRKAALAAWLHQTAVRAALAIRKRQARRRDREELTAEPMDRRLSPLDGIELQGVLDEQLAVLPTKYRDVVVLCDLEGLTRKQAASRLDIPLATVTTRVGKGRSLLRRRLLRRGVAVGASGAVFPAGTRQLSAEAIRQATKSAAMHAAGKSAAEIGISQTVVQTAIGVLRAMTITKLTTIGISALLIVGVASPIGALLNSGLFESSANAVTVPVDNFDDGNDEGWIHFLTGSDIVYDASGQNYHLRTVDLVPPGQGGLTALWAPSDTPFYSNGYFRARVQINNQGVGGQLLMRGDLDNVNAYGFAITSEPATIGAFQIRRFDGSQSAIPLVSTPLGVSLVQPGKEWMIEAGAVGDRLTLKAWKVGDPEPDEPILTAFDSTHSSGRLGVTAGVSPDASGPAMTSMVYDDLFFNSIPEPSSAIMCPVLIGLFTAWYWRRRW